VLIINATLSRPVGKCTEHNSRTTDARAFESPVFMQSKIQLSRHGVYVSECSYSPCNGTLDGNTVADCVSPQLYHRGSDDGWRPSVPYIEEMLYRGSSTILGR
jgi:hypothetical protein